MRVLINYADAKYVSAQHWNTLSAKYIAKIDKIYSFHPEDIDLSFFNENEDILSQKRGNGLWLWKPYFINKIIHTLKDGDILFYCDSGSIFIRYPQVVYETLNSEQPLFICDIPLIESCWTKPLCFTEMDCNSSDIKYSNQIIGTYFAIYVNDFTRHFINEWLQLCCRYELISPEGIAKNEILKKEYGYGFVSHREDQSIFSLLCKKYNISTHRDISHRKPISYKTEHYAYKEPLHPYDTYKPIIFLHKQPNLSSLLLKWIYNKLHLTKLKKILYH